MKIATLFFLSFVLILVGFEPAIGCWCARKTLYTKDEFRGAVAKEFRLSSAVFSGEVTNKNQTQIKFKIAKVWKGSIVDEVMLSSEYYVQEKGETLLVNCAYSHFEIGKSYLVYADHFESRLQVNECSRTQLLNKAPQDIKELDKLRAVGHAQARPLDFDQTRHFPSMAKPNKALQLTAR